jgi:pimeloyl-ACP methyl ester carboxylesterase
MISPRHPATPPDSGLVVLIHGLWMGAPACALLGHRLRAHGYAVHAFPYRSVRQTLEESAARLHAWVKSQSPALVHLVGHSLGGLVALRAVAQHPDLPVGRIVLLGSPCNGCAAADQLLPSPQGRWLVGNALPGWRAGFGEAAARRCQVGAIAGTRRLGLGMLMVRLDGPNDGVVRVAETWLPGFADRVVLPVTHSGMLVARSVAEQAAAFLAQGRFVRRTAASL